MSADIMEINGIIGYQHPMVMTSMNMGISQSPSLFSQPLEAQSQFGETVNSGIRNKLYKIVS